MPNTESPGERLDRSLAKLHSAFLSQPKSASAGHTAGPANNAVMAGRANRPAEQVAPSRLLGWQFARSLKSWMHWRR